MSQSDRAQIGFKKYDDGEVETVNSIFVYENTVLLVDKVFGNIKMINMSNGKLSASEVLEMRDTVKLNDLVVFNNLIFVATDSDVIYVLDRNLKKIKQLQTSTEVYGFRTFVIKNDSLYFFDFPGDTDQRKDYSVFVKGTNISTDLSMAQKNFEVGKGFDKILRLINGFDPTDKDNCISIAGQMACLNVPFPNQCACEQVFASEKSIAFFERKGDRLLVKIFEPN